jgi:hypothetical protein
VAHATAELSTTRVFSRNIGLDKPIGEKMTTKRVGLVTVPSALLLLGSAVFAPQEPAWKRGEIGVQGTAFLTKNSQGNGIPQHATDTPGFIVGYHYDLNKGIAAEDLQANVRQATADLVVKLPATSRINPYVLAERGV